jgi:hypothetical protein
MQFSYAYASTEQLVAHLATVSRASLSAARKRYRTSGHPDVVDRIDAALVQVRINRLQQLLPRKDTTNHDQTK